MQMKRVRFIVVGIFGACSLWWLLKAAILGLFILSLNCSKNHEHPILPPEESPPDTVSVSVFVTCDTVDLTVEFTVAIGQNLDDDDDDNDGDEGLGGKAVFAVFRNGVEVDRFVTTSETEISFQVTFEAFIITQEMITIRKIEGHGEAIGAAVVEIQCHP